MSASKPYVQTRITGLELFLKLYLRMPFASTQA